MIKRLENKVVLITGGSKGIGAGMAKKMSMAGAKVIINYASDFESAKKVETEIAQKGGDVQLIKADISKQTEVEHLFEETVQKFGRLDVLVNNAGIYGFSLLEGVTEDNYRKMFDINVLGILLSSKEAIKYFDKHGGSIINISSFAGTRPEPYSVIYCATKGAVDSITYALSQELGVKSIRVNSIRPGGVFTEGVANLGVSLESDSIQSMIKRSALGRMANPDDIGDMAVFLASDESKIITGQTIEVSGGFK